VGVLRVTVLDACGAGIRRVGRAPAALAGVWLITVLAGVPLAFGVRAAIAEHLGSSLEADTAAAGANYHWMHEFSEQPGGIASGFGPAVIGFAAVLDNFSTFIDGGSRPAAIAGVGLLYLLAWTVLAGGLIDRFARDRAIGAPAFFQACGGCAGRLLRLAVISTLTYAVLFGSLHPWLLDRTYDDLIRNVNVERTALLVRFALYAVFAALLAAANLLFDYAKIRLVVEDRRSAIGALRAAGRFVFRHWRGCIALYAADLALLVAVVIVYALVAPGVGSAGLSMWLGLAVAQCYIAARLWVKLVFWASETAWFQSQLAYAGYAAMPLASWSESDSAESGGNGGEGPQPGRQ
jgi:hypothetical protein